MTATTPAPRPAADLYLRLSDLRNEDQLDGREDRLRAEAGRLGWDVHRVIVENDLTPGNGNGRSRPASAFRRKKIRLPNGQVALRTVRPGFRSMLDDLADGIVAAILAEDLDRLLRQPRDGEDLLDAVELSGATARSLTGSLALTKGGTNDERFMARIMAATANKASADTARRVAAGRERYAGRSYQGGKRPYGYEPDPDAPRYGKTLIIREAEAAVIRQAADAILGQGVGLKPLARDLRERQQRGEPGTGTVMGAAWTPSTLRDVLLKPAVAGLAVHPSTRELIDAPWPAILDRDTWERLRDTLTDPGRKTSPGNEPRWLVSKIARCQCGSTVRVNGVRQGRAAYVCDAGGHLKRAAHKVDEVVEGRMIWRLSQPDAETLLLPPPVPGAVDTAQLNAELKELRKRRREQIELHAEGIITKADLAGGIRRIEDDTAQIKARLATARRADPLKEFRDRPADVVWDALTVARKRAVIRLLADITFAPVAPSGPVFNPDSVVITWKA
jgi:DNA invertase Pin-like site-specific DNA recombinase